MILITGAAGKTGRAILQGLTERGEPVRAYVHRTDQIAATYAAGATEVLVGDLQDATALDQAMQGIGAIYHICPNMHPAEVSIGQGMIAAAQAAAVEHFVYHSVLHPQTEAMPHHWYKLRVEESLLASGLPFTILQPAPYMQNLLTSWPQIRDQGRYRIPYPAQTQLSLVDLADVGTVAATVLTQTGHQGATYALAGTPGLSQTAVAATFATILKRPIQVEERDQLDWASAARASGLSDYAIDTLCKMFVYYAQYGLIGNPNLLGWLLGRPPTSLTTFAQRLAQ